MLLFGSANHSNAAAWATIAHTDGGYFRYTLAHPGQVRNPDEALSIWRSEFSAAVSKRRHVTYVMHPEIIGRAPELAALERFLDDVSEEADVWFATHADVAARVEVAA